MACGKAIKDHYYLHREQKSREKVKGSIKLIFGDKGIFLKEFSLLQTMN